MSDPKDVSTHRSATRGLATVALLKVNYDAGHDHIGMFEPFVLDAVGQIDAGGATVEDVRTTIRSRHQLVLPVNTLRTLLGRVCKRGYLRREGGGYFRTDETPKVDDLVRKREFVELRQSQLAEALCGFCATRGVDVADTEEALAMILDFLEQNHVALALDDLEVPRQGAGTALAGEPTVTRTATTTAAFLQEIGLSGGDLADVIQEMLEGFVLQNTLLLKDISTAARRFDNLHVFFDNGLLFGALGLRGPVFEQAIKELLTLLRDTGAVLDVFEPTIREMKRILAVYEARIGTSAGRLSLYPTDLTRFVLTNHLTPSDIRARSAMLERDLRMLSFNIRETPERQAAFTLDEKELGSLLAERPGDENVPRVVHDTDCVAGVLTYRRGAASDSWETANAVFVTSTGIVVRTVDQWYVAQGGRGVPPVIHYLLLSNLAWLKRPASASKLKLHELVALCAAALRPSREAWEAFLKHLRRLEETGELSSDEVTAIVATSLTDNILADEMIDEDSDAATLGEVVERVKAEYRVHADEQIRQAQQAAQESVAEAHRIRAHVGSRARQIAGVTIWVVTGLLALCLVAGTLIGISNAASGESPGTWALVLAICPLAVIGLLSLFTGFHLKGWRKAQQEGLARLLERWLSDGG